MKEVPPVPAGAWDCHTHVFGPYDRFPLAGARTYSPPPAPLPGLVRHLSTTGTSRVVLVQPHSYGTDHRALLDAATRLGDGARSVVVLPPESVAEFAAARLPGVDGVRGVRLNLHTAGAPDLDQARTLVREYAQVLPSVGWHLQLFAGPAILRHVADDLAALEVPVVLDHIGLALGSTEDRAFLLDLVAGSRTWVKLSAPERSGVNPEDPVVARTVQALVDLAGERLVYGSDWPHSALQHSGAGQAEPYRQVDDVARLVALTGWLGADSVDVMVANPRRLYE